MLIIKIKGYINEFIISGMGMKGRRRREENGSPLLLPFFGHQQINSVINY